MLPTSGIKLIKIQYHSLSISCNRLTEIARDGINNAKLYKPLRIAFSPTIPPIIPTITAAITLYKTNIQNCLRDALPLKSAYCNFSTSRKYFFINLSFYRVIHE